MSTGVLVALRGDREPEVVAAVDATEHLVVVRRCADLAELVAAALAGLGRVALVDAALAPDRALVARLAQVGTLTVVVARERDLSRYAEIGAATVPLTADAATVVATLTHALQTPVEVVSVATPERPPASGRPGGLIAVTGAHGSPGRTTVAVNLAAEIAAHTPVLLIDADVWGAGVAAALGLLDDHAGLAAAVRAADRGTLDATSLRTLCAQVTPQLQVLPGLSRGHRWREVSGPGIDPVWAAAADLATWVVVDAASAVPDTDRAGFDAVLGPRRNAVLESAVDAADHVVVVGAAEPLGITRLVQTVLDLPEQRAGQQRHVVVTRVRAEAAGPRPAESVREALHRFAGVEEVTIVPDDRTACDRAALAGAVLSETSPRSPARTALADLAQRLTGQRPGRSRRWRRRASSSAAG